jgi:hypothetical protein
MRSLQRTNQNIKLEDFLKTVYYWLLWENRIPKNCIILVTMGKIGFLKIVYYWLLWENRIPKNYVLVVTVKVNCLDLVTVA